MRELGAQIFQRAPNDMALLCNNRNPCEYLAPPHDVGGDLLPLSHLAAELMADIDGGLCPAHDTQGTSASEASAVPSRPDTCVITPSGEGGASI
jgi:hypothetical protein